MRTVVAAVVFSCYVERYASLARTETSLDISEDRATAFGTSASTSSSVLASTSLVVLVKAETGGGGRGGSRNRKGTDLSIRPLHAYELLLALLLGNQCPCEFCDTTSFSLKIGRNIAITIPPTIMPRKTISMGSINEVRASSIASISSSQKSAIFSSMLSILPV